MRASLRMEAELDEATQAEPDLEWSFNPWKERPLRSLVAAALTLAMGLLLLALGMPPLAAAVLTAALAGSLAPLLLPRRCRLDGAGVAQRGLFGWELRRWEDIGRARWVRGGLLVSPFAEPQRLDAFRALLLPMRTRERDALIAEIRRRLTRHGL